MLLERLETTAGADGRFRFPRLPVGEYRLSASRQGFQPVQFDIALRPREIQDLVVEMTLRPLQEMVEVTAAENFAAPLHSPGSTTISPEWLERIPLPQRTNLADTIVLSAPGMIRGHDDFVHVRGHEVALNPFINGVSFWENPHTVFSPGLGADYIASMSVMTGGFPAEYGNRFGGVLDIVTKSGLTMPNRGSVTFGLGTALRHNAGFELGGRMRRLGYYVNGTGFESARFLSPPEEIALHDTGRGARTFAQVDYVADSKNTFRLTLMGDGANFQLPKTLLDAAWRPGFSNFQRTRSQTSILAWDRIHSGDLRVHTAFYQRYSRVRMLPNADRYGAKLDAARTLETYGIRSDWTRYAGGHALKGGVDLVLLRPEEAFTYLSQPWIQFTHLPEINQSHIHFRGPNRGPVVFEQQKTGGQISAYVQDQFRLTRSLRADIGVRYDRYSLASSAYHFSPRLNIAYTLSSGTVLYSSYNHFFVPPPVENVLAGSSGLTRFVSEIGVPLPPLRPIVEDQVELGVLQLLAQRLRLGLAGYYRLSDNPVHTVLFPDSRFYAYANFDKGVAYGMEVKVEAPVLALGLSGYLNYALGRVWFHNPVTAGFITEAEHLSQKNRFLAPMDQTHTLTAGLTYQHRRGRLSATMFFEYGSGTPGSHPSGDHAHEDAASPHSHATGHGLCGERCPEHFTQNLSVAWHAVQAGEQARLIFQFNIENLTNNVYLLSKESTFVQGQYSIPRMFSASLKVRF